MKERKLISVKDFSQEELRRWQLKLLEILVYFRDFCDANELKFYLAGGTCLGAIRHHGFIPWDDDVDIQMPRDDYEKLLKLWPLKADTTKFECLTTTKDVCSKFPMTIIKSVNTTCIYNHGVDEDIPHGLKIDVEFLDGVPDNKFMRMINKICAQFLALFRAQRVPERMSKLTKLIAKFLLTILNKRILWSISIILENQIKKYKFENYEYVRYLASPLQKRSSYDSIIFVDFEGYKMPIPIGYDQYLSSAYGDYMQLPPENQRKPATDNLVFYDLDHSYREYKGKYYCVE